MAALISHYPEGSIIEQQPHLLLSQLLPAFTVERDAAQADFPPGHLATATHPLTGPNMTMNEDQTHEQDEEDMEDSDLDSDEEQRVLQENPDVAARITAALNTTASLKKNPSTSHHRSANSSTKSQSSSRKKN